MTGFQPVIVDDEVRCYINFNRVTLLAWEPDGEGHYQVVAYDRFPRDSKEAAKVVIARYISRDAAERAAEKLYGEIVRFNSD